MFYPVNRVQTQIVFDTSGPQAIHQALENTLLLIVRPWNEEPSLTHARTVPEGSSSLVRGRSYKYLAYTDSEPKMEMPIFCVMLALLLTVHVKENDRALAERLKQREPRAMAELYDRYGMLAYSLTYRIVHDVGIAEDLVQETFLRVCDRTQGFDV